MNQDIFETRSFFLPESAFRPDETSETTHRCSLFLKPLSRVCLHFVLFCFAFVFFGTDGFANSCRQLNPDYFEFN